MSEIIGCCNRTGFESYNRKTNTAYCMMLLSGIGALITGLYHFYGSRPSGEIPRSIQPAFQTAEALQSNCIPPFQPNTDNSRNWVFFCTRLIPEVIDTVCGQLNETCRTSCLTLQAQFNPYTACPREPSEYTFTQVDNLLLARNVCAIAMLAFLALGCCSLFKQACCKSKPRAVHSPTSQSVVFNNAGVPNSDQKHSAPTAC